VKWGVFVLLFAALCQGYSTPDLARCSGCSIVITKAYAALNTPTPTYDETVDVVMGLCDTIDNKTLAEQCTAMIDDDVLSLPKLLFNRVPAPDICVAAGHCKAPAIPPPAAPVLIDEPEVDTTRDDVAVAEEIDSKVEARTKAIKDQAALELHNAQDIAQHMAPTINVAAPPPAGGGSGLAWDKHDFDVSNNKGGDVEVEVNMAAPMNGGDDDNSALEDLGPLLESLMAPPEIDPLALMNLLRPSPAPAPLNISDLIGQLRDLMTPPAPSPYPSQVPPPPPPPAPAAPEIDLSFLKDLIPTYKPAPPPPPPPQIDIAAIIEALHPPPQPVTPPLDVAALMREMRNAIEAGRPPPQPPAGIDPQLMDLLKQMMQDLKDMHEKMNNARDNAATPYPLPPMPTPPPTDDSTGHGSGTDAHSGEPPLPVVAAPPPPPPMSHQGLTMEDLQNQLQDMMKKFQAPQPLPAFPGLSSSSNSDLEALKALLAQQIAASSKPIILPPPVVNPSQPLSTEPTCVTR